MGSASLMSFIYGTRALSPTFLIVSIKPFGYFLSFDISQQHCNWQAVDSFSDEKYPCSDIASYEKPFLFFLMCDIREAGYFVSINMQSYVPTKSTCIVWSVF